MSQIYHNFNVTNNKYRTKNNGLCDNDNQL